MYLFQSEAVILLSVGISLGFCLYDLFHFNFVFPYILVLSLVNILWLAFVLLFHCFYFVCFFFPFCVVLLALWTSEISDTSYQLSNMIKHMFYINFSYVLHLVSHLLLKMFHLFHACYSGEDAFHSTPPLPLDWDYVRFISWPLVFILCAKTTQFSFPLASCSALDNLS